MISQPPPIQFDRSTGVLEGANAWERTAALALATGSKISSHFSHRGYIGCANLLRKTLPERNIAIKLNPDATFEFPYGDGYWIKLLNRSYHYEDELELLFRDSADVDYTLLDCGANYGYWSVLVSSAPFGSRKSIAIEPSSQNFAKLSNNASINGNRFEVMQSAIGAVPYAPAIKIVTNDFMFTGGDGYTAFAGGTDVLQPGDALLDVTIDYITAHSPVTATVEGRVTKG